MFMGACTLCVRVHVHARAWSPRMRTIRARVHISVACKLLAGSRKAVRHAGRLFLKGCLNRTALFTYVLMIPVIFTSNAIYMQYQMHKGLRHPPPRHSWPQRPPIGPSDLGRRP